MAVKLSVCVPLLPFATPEYIAVLGATAEELGFHTLWVGDHVVLVDEYQSAYPCSDDGKMPGTASENVELDPFTSLAFIARETTTLRLATGVCVLPQRNPVYSAKMAANIDWLSNGRFTFGVGAGWLVEEFQAVGAPFDRRWARTESALRVCRTLWRDDISEHHDEFVDLPPSRMFPKPIQPGGPPVYVGGNSLTAKRLAANMADGWYALAIAPDAMAIHLAALENELKRVGRPPSDLAVAACPYPNDLDRDTAAAYADLGIDEVIAIVVPDSVQHIRGQLGALADSVGSTLTG